MGLWLTHSGWVEHTCPTFGVDRLSCLGHVCPTYLLGIERQASGNAQGQTGAREKGMVMIVLGYVLFFLVGMVGALAGGFLVSTLVCLLVEGLLRGHVTTRSAKVIGAIVGGAGGGFGMYLVALAAVRWFGCSGGFLAGGGAALYSMISWKVKGAKYGIPCFLLLYLPLTFALP